MIWILKPTELHLAIRLWEPCVFLQHLFGASSSFGSSFGGVDHGKTRNASDHLETLHRISETTTGLNQNLYSETTTRLNQNLYFQVLCWYNWYKLIFNLPRVWQHGSFHCTSIPNTPCCKTSKSGQFSSASLSWARSKLRFKSSFFCRVTDIHLESSEPWGRPSQSAARFRFLRVYHIQWVWNPTMNRKIFNHKVLFRIFHKESLTKKRHDVQQLASFKPPVLKKTSRVGCGEIEES